LEHNITDTKVLYTGCSIFTSCFASLFGRSWWWQWLF